LQVNAGNLRNPRSGEVGGAEFRGRIRRDRGGVAQEPDLLRGGELIPVVGEFINRRGVNRDGPADEREMAEGAAVDIVGVPSRRIFADLLTPGGSEADAMVFFAVIEIVEPAAASDQVR
jgi:hypothetical protein